MVRRTLEGNGPNDAVIHTDHAQVVPVQRLAEGARFKIGSDAELMRAHRVPGTKYRINQAFPARGARRVVAKKIPRGSERRHLISLRSLRRSPYIVIRTCQTDFNQIAIDDELVLNGCHYHRRPLIDCGLNRVQDRQAIVPLVAAVIQDAESQRLPVGHIPLKAREAAAAEAAGPVLTLRQRRHRIRGEKRIEGRMEPQFTFSNGPGGHQTRRPVAQMQAAVCVERRERIGCPKTPFVVAHFRLDLDRTSRAFVFRRHAIRIPFHRLYRIHTKPRGSDRQSPGSICRIHPAGNWSRRFSPVEMNIAAGVLNRARHERQRLAVILRGGIGKVENSLLVQALDFRGLIGVDDRREYGTSIDSANSFR